MRYFSSLLLIIFAFLISGCSTSAVTISPDYDSKLSRQVTPVDLTRNIDPPDMDLLNALKYIIDGEFALAESTFSHLSYSSLDTLIKQKAKSGLVQMMILQSKWNELKNLPEEYFDNDITEKYLAQAYATAKKERYVFTKDEFEIPIKLSRFGNPMIDVYINGKPYTFWLDTGAGLSVVSSKVAEASGIKSIDVNEIIYAKAGTGKKIPVKPIVISEIVIGDLTIRNHPAMLINEDDLTLHLLKIFTIFKIDGIIGWNAIQNLDIEIDYKHKTTLVRRPQKKSVNHRNMSWFISPTVRLSTLSNKNLYFYLDTGSNRTTVTEYILSKVDTSGIQQTTAFSGSAGGIVKRKVYVLRNQLFLLTNSLLNFKKITGLAYDDLPHTSFFQRDGVLGSDIFQNGKIHIDFINGQFLYSQ